MKSNHKPYDHIASFRRIREILNQPDIAYEEAKSLPSRDRLTYINGFYANCTALFVDIRGSSQLPKRYKRPTLARLYRAYVSEVVAILNSFEKCREVNIVGDGAWAVYNTPNKSDIDEVFSLAARVNSMVKVLNYELEERGKNPIKVGLGMAYGRALMVKAGFSGSGIDEVVYMGDVVNRAAKIAAFGSKTANDKPLMVDEVVYGNLSDHRQGLLDWNVSRGCYHGNVIRTVMEKWFDENCT